MGWGHCLDTAQQPDVTVGPTPRWLDAVDDTFIRKRSAMDWTIELVVVPVSDIDRAKAFYTIRSAWRSSLTSPGLR
jgi:hypothetical protein